MWGTSHGDRTLAGHEAALVRKAVAYLRDMITASIDVGEPHDTDVAIFNAIQPTQQLAVLHQVAFALLDDETPIPELTAIREATVYSIYKELGTLIEMEIDFADHVEPEFQTRALIIKAIEQIKLNIGEWGSEAQLDPRGTDGLDADSTDMSQWSKAIEFLANQVLWDRDFELEEIFADHDPGKIDDIKAYLGIQKDYFSTPAPDAYSDEFQRIDGELISLTRSEQA